MKLQIFRPSLCLIVAILALAGCAATTPLQQQELRDLAPNEGMVVGSVWIKGGRDVLGRTRYDLVINKAEKKIFITPDHTVEAQREGDEVVFAIIMPAGDYRISELRQLGFSNFVRSTNFGFHVEPGKIRYIGRLLVEFPQETITIYTPIRFTVEDAMDATLRAAKSKYGKDFVGASVRLMAMASTGRSDLPITRNNAQITFPRYSIVVPPDRGWYVARPDERAEVAVVTTTLDLPGTPATFRMQFSRNEVLHEVPRSWSARQVADDFRGMERQIMIEQGVNKGLYKLGDVVMGEESVGDKKFYTMKYTTSDSRVHQSATLYLFFPKEEKNAYFMVIHYSETIPRGAAVVDLPFHRDFLETLKSLRINE